MNATNTDVSVYFMNIQIVNIQQIYIVIELTFKIKNFF